MSDIPPVYGTNTLSFLKPFCLIFLTIYMIFGGSNICLYRYTSICKCKLPQMYFKTLCVIVEDSTIIKTSGKKAHSFPIFAYFF